MSYPYSIHPSARNGGTAVYWVNPIFKNALSKRGISRAKLKDRLNPKLPPALHCKSLAAVGRIWGSWEKGNGVPLTEQVAKAFALTVRELLSECGDETKYEEEDVIHPARYYIEPQRFQMPTTRGANPIAVIAGRARKYNAIPERVVAGGFLTREHARSIARILMAEIHKAGHMTDVDIDNADSLVRSQSNDGQCFKQAYYPIKYP